MSEWKSFFGRSDVVTLHVPANDKTRHMIDAEAFARMKDGAILINTARGSIVETEALLEALASGRLRAAGLDVLPEEPVVREEAELLRSYFNRDHRLDNLLADPHPAPDAQCRHHPAYGVQHPGGGAAHFLKYHPPTHRTATAGARTEPPPALTERQRIGKGGP